MLVEICCDNFASCKNALEYGADRIELCENLAIGGVTPSAELLQACVSLCAPFQVPLMVMIRCRGGDFQFSDDEKLQMLKMIDSVKEYKVDGIVVGALTSTGTIDAEFITECVQRAIPLSVTFHKAFDVITSEHDTCECMKILERCGVSRVLSSGRNSTAEAGLSVLHKMVELSPPITIVAGSVRRTNVQSLQIQTNTQEIHSRTPDICSSLRKEPRCIRIS